MRIKISREPDIVDNFGTKWWKDIKGTKSVEDMLYDTSLWLIEEMDGRQCFVLCRMISGKNRVLHESDNLNQIKIWLDNYKDQLFR